MFGRCHLSEPGNADGSWLESAWEYMHFHSLLVASNVGRFGIWESNGDIVAVCFAFTVVSLPYA